MNDIPLHDIKPLVEVPDNSLTFLVIISAVIFSLLLVVLGLWIWKKYKNDKALNIRKEYLLKIHEVNTDNAKQAAYEISEYGRALATSEKEIALLDSLDKRLSVYKYKKEVGKIDDETLGHFRVFLEVLDAT
jgi:hypothetical protein